MMQKTKKRNKIKMQLLWLFLFCNIACAQKHIIIKKK